MTHRWSAGLAFVALVAMAIAVPHGAAGQTAPARIPVPVFDVDPSWPKPLPNNWTFGQFAGVHVDSRDHIWIVQRPRTLEPDENALTITPPPADCCAPAPPIMEFDMEGNFIQGWGGPGAGYDWPENEHGVFVDHNDNVWVGGNGPNDHHVLKFTRTGTFVMQIGRPGMSKGSDDTDNLNRPAQIFVVPSTNEAFIADGYGNRRVIVFDADTGRYKRHWGAYGARPDDAASNTPVPVGAASRQFNTLHGVRVSRDGIVYAADRVNNRIQAFRADGTFLNEVFIARQTAAQGVVYEVAFSPDPEQRFIYVPDGSNNHIWIVERSTLRVLGNFARQGRYAGQFHHSHSMSVDSQGNLYVAETQGKRVQKFTFQGLR